MEEWQCFAIAALALLAGLFLGQCVGIYGERYGWKLRANKHAAHHCDGEFYAVFTEQYFLDNYQPRPICQEEPDDIGPR